MAEKKRCVSPRNGNELIPGNPGNSGGKKGRSGRPPDEFKRLMSELASSDETEAALREILKDKDHPQFSRVFQQVADRSEYGPPKQTVAHEGDGIPIEIVRRTKRDDGDSPPD